VRREKYLSMRANSPGINGLFSWLPLRPVVLRPQPCRAHH
jgi:hypothetical protein